MPANARGFDLTLEEELWFGDFPDDDAERAAASSMVAMAGKVLGLRPFPAEAQQILSMSRDPSCKLEDIAKLIEADPGFAARTLRLVNSAALATRNPCKSIHQSVVRVGTRTIGEMAIAAATMQLTSDEEHALELRAHAMMVGGLARHLAVRLGLPADDTYTCGLMHDIGKQLQLQDADDVEEYRELLIANKDVDEVHVAERQLYGYDHAVLAAHVLRAWKIPEPVPTVVAYHHQLQRAADAGHEIGRMVAVVRVADQLAHGWYKPVEELLPQVVASAAGQHLGVEERQLARWWLELAAVAEESVAADEALAQRPLERTVRCETCGSDQAAPCCDCLRAFCEDHGDLTTGLCRDCEAIRNAEDLNHLGAPQGRKQRALIVTLALGAAVSLGLLLLYALS